MNLKLNSPTISIKGVGEKYKNLLNAVKISTVFDLLLHFPMFYIDFSKIKRELGFNITKTVPDGIKEIKDVIELGIISDPENQKYYNIPRKT